MLREPHGLPLRILEVSVETKVNGGAGENGTLVTVVVTGDSPILMLVAVMVGCFGSGCCLFLKEGVGENRHTGHRSCYKLLSFYIVIGCFLLKQVF